MLKIMISMFLVFSILQIPALAIYSSHNGMGNLTNSSRDKFSLGNFGFSSTVCSSTYTGIGLPLNFDCRIGSISEIYSIGLLPQGKDRTDYCGLPEDDSDAASCTKNFLRASDLKTELET
jgi:hypothetical protein